MGRPRTDIAPRIVRAARARFLAQGVDGASLRAIDADAATNVGMVFYYFPTKDDLFLAVVEEVYAGLHDDLGRALAGDAPVPERLKQAFARLGRASDGEIEVVRLVVREALLSSDRFRRILARMRAGHLAMLLSTLREGVRRGEIDASIPIPMPARDHLRDGGRATVRSARRRRRAAVRFPRPARRGVGGALVSRDRAPRSTGRPSKPRRRGARTRKGDRSNTSPAPHVADSRVATPSLCTSGPAT